MNWKLFAIGVMMISTLNGFSDGKEAPKAKATPKEETKSLPVVTIEMKNGGIIKFEMYPDTSPKTVDHISALVQKGFYNGLTFHRVVPGFVIQGGDPNGNGTGGSGKNIPAEFNSRKHILGTVAMARSQDPNSADSQFYICLDKIPYLDGNYTVFGQVIDGIDVVKKVNQGDVMKKVTIHLPEKETDKKAAPTPVKPKK